MKLNYLLDQVKRQIEYFREAPDGIETFIALETALQDFARDAHNEAWERTVKELSKQKS